MERSSIGTKIKENKYELAIIAILICSLAYCLKGTFNHDDVIWYYFRGAYYLNGLSLFDIIFEGMKSWMSRGRFFPLSTFVEDTYLYVLQDFHFYELSIILFICLDVILFGKFIYDISHSKKVKLLGMLSIIVFFQVYSNYHNAIIGYASLLQILVFFLLSQLIFFVKYLESSNKKHLYMSLFFQLLAVTWYEVGYINVLLIFLIYFMKEKDGFCRKIRNYILFCLPTLVCAVITIVLRVTFSSSYYEGINVAIDLKKVLKTFLLQMYSAFPLSHFIALGRNGIGYLKNISIMDCIVVIAFIAVFYMCMKTYEKEVYKPQLMYLLVAICVFVFPGMLIAITQKYQQELYRGISHISVYVQYFGLCAVILWFYLYMEHFLYHKKMFTLLKWIEKGVIFVAAVILLINLQVTKVNIRDVQKDVKYPREAVIEALDKGFLDVLSDGDVLFSVKNAKWDSDSFFSQYAHKKVPVVYGFDYVNNFEAYKQKRVYFINYLGTSEGRVVVMCHSDSVELSSDGSVIEKIPTDEIFYYIEGESGFKTENWDFSEDAIKKKVDSVKVNNLNFIDLELW